jgi:hypothetical protein
MGSSDQLGAGKMFLPHTGPHVRHQVGQSIVQVHGLYMYVQKIKHLDEEGCRVGWEG